MKVVIFCGGLGTRLREETEFRPKPMVNIGTRPILWHIMKIFAHYGYHNFILALGYKGDMIKHYFFNYELMNNDVTIELGKPDNLCFHQTHDESDWQVTLANTGEKALKGARLKRIQPYIQDDLFMVTYGDGLANVDIPTLLAFHKSHGKLATITAINPASRFGELQITGDQITSFSEKPDNHEGFINGGYMVFNKKIFDYLSPDNSCDLEIGVLDQLAQEGQLMVFKHHGFWACMDTLRDTEYLNGLWESNKAGWKIWK
jgi:glucose-1-phosphate cytidylyltransferase